MTIVAVAVGVTLLQIDLTLGEPISCGDTCWDIVVTSASAPESLDVYTVRLDIPEQFSPAGSARLAPGVIFGPIIRLTFTDMNVPNRLDIGDVFRLENPSNLGTCTLSVSSIRAHASVRWTC